MLYHRHLPCRGRRPYWCEHPGPEHGAHLWNGHGEFQSWSIVNGGQVDTSSFVWFNHLTMYLIVTIVVELLDGLLLSTILGGPKAVLLRLPGKMSSRCQVRWRQSTCWRQIFALHHLLCWPRLLHLPTVPTMGGDISYPCVLCLHWFSLAHTDIKILSNFHHTDL